MLKEKMEEFRANRHLYSPQGWFQTVILAHLTDHADVAIEKADMLFTILDIEKPDDWFAWFTSGVVTDAEAREWKDLTPDPLSVAMNPGALELIERYHPGATGLT